MPSLAASPTAYGLMDAVTLRRECSCAHFDDGPRRFALAHEVAYDERIGPWLRAANSVGRTFARSVRSQIDGTERHREATKPGERSSRAPPSTGPW